MFNSQGGFKNFWHYNKWKIFSLIALILFIAFAVSQCSYGSVTDFEVLHISGVRDVSGDEFIKRIKNDVELVSEGNDPNAEFMHIFVPQDMRDIIETGALEKIQVEMVGGNSTLFILDKETIYSYKDNEFFYDLTQIADSFNVPEEKRYLGANGEVCAISVDGNKYLQECNLQCDSLYIAVRNHSEKKSDEYINAFAVLNHILSNN